MENGLKKWCNAWIRVWDYRAKCWISQLTRIDHTGCPFIWIRRSDDTMVRYGII